jgi:hypothetical protein
MYLGFGALLARRSNARVARAATPVSDRLHTICLPGNDGDVERMTIRLADCEGQRNRANMLLERMYSWRGYGTNHRLPVAPNCVTFTASSHEDVIGTLTLTVDSPAGLAADATFSDELERFRIAPGVKVCELTKFAFDTSTPARPRLAALFHIIFLYGSMHHDCTDLFIEVNPRHVRFYEAMLGFSRVGGVRTNEAVGAPAQLMWLNVGEIRRYIDRDAGEDGGSGRSLYRHFFSAREEKGIYGRLAGLTEQTSIFSRFARSR